MCKIKKKAGNVIWLGINNIYLKAPHATKHWSAIAQEFMSQWNFPTCLRAIDWKKIAIECRKMLDQCFIITKILIALLDGML